MYFLIFVKILLFEKKNLKKKNSEYFFLLCSLFCYYEKNYEKYFISENMSGLKMKSHFLKILRLFNSWEKIYFTENQTNTINLKKKNIFQNNKKMLS